MFNNQDQKVFDKFNSLQPVNLSLRIQSSMFNNTDITVYYRSTYGLNWASLQKEVGKIGDFSNINIQAITIAYHDFFSFAQTVSISPDDQGKISFVQFILKLLTEPEKAVPTLSKEQSEILISKISDLLVFINTIHHTVHLKLKSDGIDEKSLTSQIIFFEQQFISF